ncbi:MULTISPECIES: SDR family oxidoreductase [Achromobacter]|uniref:SDR family oxidoreductase n=1 Tax=Achromobacter TaxID=222 RepID=UPI000F741A52|nr:MULTISPECIES: SDR family NAD(P)-dependent oxidoreductase [Achromobacter]MBD9472839.1 SDR family NAD(P)-dependent oxidoreductase [Achromobacter sp. ACM01]RSF02727.1 SDR family NAD(P)-dependent oxidoreductase [Achromobacter aegrifaciens]CAB3906037.1 3-phenylpropionate-dihydrodiol/cinnamic acid-dihydrodiol dehydrogenase [Achromobacter aegrifaciens]
MSDYISGKTIVITGAGGGFGRQVAQQAAARGALVTCGDIDADAAAETVARITAAGGRAQALAADVRILDDLRGLVGASVQRYGSIDVMLNNAGIMPLAFVADHSRAYDAWMRCIDINMRGVFNGMIAAHDAMIFQGRGHFINISSIYGDFPAVGAAIYGATKAAVNFMSEAVRTEARGKIKVTTISPTGVPNTGLGGSVANHAAAVGRVGNNMEQFMAMVKGLQEGALPPDLRDPESLSHMPVEPDSIADAILLAIDQPWGVSVSDMTVRASADCFVL